MGGGAGAYLSEHMIDTWSFSALNAIAKEVQDSFAMDQNQKVVIMLGKTGSGKSSLCNVIAGEKNDNEEFPTSGGVKSCTQGVNSRNVNFMGESDKPLTLVDTIGFDDPDKDDKTEVITEVIKNLTDHVDTFVIAVNGQNPRLDASLERMLKIFGEAFTSAFWKHVVVVFTQLSMDNHSTLTRQRKRKNQSDDEWGRSFLAEVEKFAGFSLKYLFIDALYAADSDSMTEEDVKQFVDNMGKLYGFISSSKGLKTDKEKQLQFLLNCTQEEQQRKDEEAKKEFKRLEKEKLETEEEAERLRKLAREREEEAKQERLEKEKEQEKSREIARDRDRFIRKIQVADDDLASSQQKVTAERTAREEIEKEAERLRREAQAAQLRQTSAERDKIEAEKENLELRLELANQKKVQEIQRRSRNFDLKPESAEEVASRKEKDQVSQVGPQKTTQQMRGNVARDISADEENRRKEIKNSIRESSTQGEFERSSPEILLIQAMKAQVSGDGVQIFGCGGKPKGSCQEKTIVLAGAKGRGKSYFLKCLVNYIYCVDEADTFRFILPGPNHSKYFRVYRFFNSLLGFTLSVIDTPTFGPDTASDLMDDRISQGIQTLLQNEVESVLAVCLIVNATDEQLTKTEIEVFNGLNKHFGRDPSVCVIANHCDSGAQPIKIEVDKLMSSKAKFCKFLHLRAFFEERKTDPEEMKDQQFYWRKGCESFSKFFDHLSSLKDPIHKYDIEEAQNAREKRKTKGQAKKSSESEHSEETKLSNKQIKEIMRRSARRGQADQNNPEIYLIQADASEMQEDSCSLVQIFDCGVSDLVQQSHVREKRGRTILLLGAVGRGKTFFLNCLVTFLYGVEIEDKFRFKLPGDKSQEEFRAYRFHNSRLGYTLTVINTPSFTVDQSPEDTELVHQVVQSFIRNGIGSIDAVGLIVNATDEQLTDGQKDKIKVLPEYFGRDPSLCVIANHSDRGDPPVKKAIDQIVSTEAKLCKFRHLGTLFEPVEANPEEKRDQVINWERATKSFEQFFQHFGSLQNAVTEADFRKAQAKRKRKETEISQWSRTHSITTQPGNFPITYDQHPAEGDPLTGHPMEKADQKDANMGNSEGCCPFWKWRC